MSRTGDRAGWLALGFHHGCRAGEKVGISPSGTTLLRVQRERVGLTQRGGDLGLGSQIQIVPRSAVRGVRGKTPGVHWGFHFTKCLLAPAAQHGGGASGF